MTRPPNRDKFTKSEWRIVQRLNTPAKVQRFFSEMPYNRESEGGSLRSFREVLKVREAHCLETALGAAVILEQHGHAPLLLDIQSKDLLDHVVYLFHDNGRWGSIGRSRDAGLQGRKSVFRSVRDLVWSYFDPYVDFTGRIRGYGIANLYDLGDYDWRFSPRRMLKIEDYLRAMPHRRLRSSDARYEKLLSRYRDYKKRFPDRSPRYYDNRWQWML
jgi:hypothetical protein